MSKFVSDLDLSNNHIVNGGFEEVSSLPTENLSIGREVIYNNEKYVYNGTDWIKVLMGANSFKVNGQTIALGDGLDSDVGVLLLGTIQDGAMLCKVSINNGVLTTIKPNNEVKSTYYLLSEPFDASDYVTNTTTSNTISSVNGWFNPQINEYNLDSTLSQSLFTNDISFADLIDGAEGRFNITTDIIDLSVYGGNITDVFTSITNMGFNCFIENDIDSMNTNQNQVVFTFKVDTNVDRVIVQCYKRV